MVNKAKPWLVSRLTAPSIRVTERYINRSSWYSEVRIVNIVTMIAVNKLHSIGINRHLCVCKVEGN